MQHSPKRILIFSLSYYPRFVGGAEVAIKEITDRISKEDIEFHMVTLRFDSSLPKVEQVGNVLVHRIGFSVPNPSIADLRKFPLRLNKFLFQFLAVKEALTLHARYRYSATWAMMAHACGIPAGLFKVMNPNIPYLLTLQEGDPPKVIERSMRFVWPLFAQGFSRADVLQAISSFLGAWGTRRGYRGQPEVIPNGVDLARFARAIEPHERAEANKVLGRTEHEIILITASRLVPKNAVDDGIRALALLPKEVVFVVCGIGPDEKMLRILAKECGVEERVRFLGEVSHLALPALLAASDIFIRPSRSEGMGNAFVEAMAAGIPVIATQEGGISDFLFDAVRNPGVPATGFAVNADAPGDIQNAVERILGSPEETKETVATARALVLREYGWDTIAGKMNGLFVRLVG